MSRLTASASLRRVGLPNCNSSSAAISVTIVGERAAQLNLVVKGAHLRLIDRQQANRELLRGSIEKFQIVGHAGARVHHHDRREGQRGVRECRRSTGLPSSRTVKSSRLEVGDQASCDARRSPWHKSALQHASCSGAKLAGCSCGGGVFGGFCAKIGVNVARLAARAATDSTRGGMGNILAMDPVDATVGLCAACKYRRTIAAARSTFYLCERSFSDARFPRYPGCPCCAARATRPRRHHLRTLKNTVSCSNESSCVAFCYSAPSRAPVRKRTGGTTASQSPDTVVPRSEAARSR